MDIERRTVTGLKWTALARLASQGVTWLSTLVVIRLLAPEDYGLMAVSAVVIGVLAGVAEFGLGASVVQARNLAPAELAPVAGALVLFNALCAVVIWVAAPEIAGIFGDERLTAVVRVASLQLVINSFATVPE